MALVGMPVHSATVCATVYRIEKICPIPVDSRGCLLCCSCGQYAVGIVLELCEEGEHLYIARTTLLSNVRDKTGNSHWGFSCMWIRIRIQKGSFYFSIRQSLPKRDLCSIILCFTFQKSTENLTFENYCTTVFTKNFFFNRT